MGRFRNGQVVGHFWIGLIKAGYIHGVANEDGLATGNDIAFIYPDGETALKGYFENKYMKNAKYVEVQKYGCDENGMFVATEFTKPLSQDEFFYDPPTNISFGGGSINIPDPYEAKTVYVDVSKIPNSGEGVFLKKDLPAKRLACFYSLYMYNENQNKLYVNNHVANISKTAEYRRNCRKYSVSLSYYDAAINIPPEYDMEPYPTLGPKVNHHFKLNNSIYHIAEHLHWELIQSVSTKIDLKVGQELFTYYGLPKRSFPEDFPWYWEMKSNLERVP